MSKPCVRRATTEDISAIVEFNRCMAKETENIDLDVIKLRSGVEAIFKYPDRGFYIVCENQSTITACLMITYEWSDWRNGFFWWIQSVFVHRNHRKQGLYKMMYAYIKDCIQTETDVVGIRLYVDGDNSTAKKVYEKVGMVSSNYQLYEYEK